MFKFWISSELTKRSLDGDAFSDYLISFLESGDDGWIEYLDSVLESNKNDEFYKEVIYYYNNQNLIPVKESVNSSITEVFKDATSEVLKTVTLVTHEEDRCDQIYPPLTESTIYNEDYTANDNYNGIDYIDIISLLEIQLQSICSLEYSSEALYFSLLRSDCDINLAIIKLIQIDHICRKCKPCRHILTTSSFDFSTVCEERCLLVNCPFEHNLGCITCKFWMGKDGCALPEGCCPFLHDIDSEYLASNPYCSVHDVTASYPFLSPLQLPESHAAFEVDDKDFPTLGLGLARVSESSSSKGSAVTVTVKGGGTSSTSTSSKAAGTHLSVSAIKLGSKSYFSKASSAHKAPQIVQPDRRAGAGALPKRDTGMDRGTACDVHQWTVSGKAVGQDYASFRADAREVAIARNKMLQEATQAYLSGSKATAKALSQRGRELNVRMKELHVEAARAIFATRNTEVSVLQQGVLDMHGLHVAEVEECLRCLLPTLASAGLKEVRVVTGSGHHTEGPQKQVSRLLPCAERVVGEMDLQYTFIKDPKGFVGGLLVRLR